MRALPRGRQLVLAGLDEVMQTEHLSGVLVLQHGRVRVERYGLGADAATRWTSFSVTKAMTDTLVGAAVAAGSIHALDDAATLYLPQLTGSAYDGVTVRQLMTMTSGVQWNEDYTSPTADNVRLYTAAVPPGANRVVEYMRHLPRAVAPGTRWHYSTGETDLLGVLLRAATGKSLAQQLSTALWQPAGMERDATWIATAADARGEEFGGSGLSATLRDFGRVGLWVLSTHHTTVAADWFTEAGRPQVSLPGGVGYGYGWWPQADGSFAALGIFGQSVLIDPKRDLVVVMLGDSATASGSGAVRSAMWLQVKAVLDGE